MKTTKFALLALFTALSVSSCKKDNPVKPTIPEEKFTQITNLKIDPEIVKKSPEALDNAAGFWYYSLDDQKVVSDQFARTGQWDFAYNCSTDMIFVNNSNSTAGTVIPGNEGKTLMTILMKSFEEVKEAPGDETSYNKRMSYTGITQRASYALNGDINPTVVGWWPTDVYSTADKIVKPLKNRTLIFKTNKGKYVKLQMQSVYKDSPENPTSASEKFYLTFRFFIQPDGSRNLDSSK